MVLLSEMEETWRGNSQVGIGLDQELYFGDTEFEVPVRKVMKF